MKIIFTSKDTAEVRPLTFSQELDEALKACKFGKFQMRLLCASMSALLVNAQIGLEVSYIMPIAECDLKMSLVKKGWMAGMSYLGTLFSSIIAGFLTDAYGRKKFLQIGFGGSFLWTLVAGSSQTYTVLVTAKFFDGVFFGMATNALISLTSEFSHKGIRDRVLLCQSSFISFGQIFIACYSWVILTQDWRLTFFNGAFVLNIWNFYLYFCSLWPLLTFVLYTLLPESPKYLLTQRKYDEARDVLIRVYVENTGQPAHTYPAYSIWRNFATENTEVTTSQSSLCSRFVTSIQQEKAIFRKPLIQHLLLISTLVFFSMSIYSVLRLWFPQLSTIMEKYHQSKPHSQDQFCVILNSYTSSLAKESTNSTDCVAKKGGAVTYISSIVLGVLCLFPYIISGILVTKVGKKALLIVCSSIVSCVTFILPWFTSRIMIVVLFSMDVALSQTMVALLQTLVVELFPTSNRSLAISFIMTFGRMGSMLGNVVFPLLLRNGCFTLFHTLSGYMTFVSVLMFLVPKKGTH